MEPIDWGHAWSIVGGGLLVVFLIMSLLATMTHFMGKYFQGLEKRKKAKAKAAAEAEGASS
jgi:Na+-transporting methylmalonyl-CoA/oxaloacetate decarboxylase gamma subunit